MRAKGGLLGLVLVVGLAGVAAADDATFATAMTDPQGDVAEMQAQGGPGTGNASYQVVPGHADVDLVRLASAPNGTDVVFTLQVAGAIRDQASASFGNGSFGGGGFGYDLAIDDRNDSQADVVVDYGGGSATLREQDTGQMMNVPASHENGTLTIRVARSLLGNVTKWSLGAQAVETESQFSNGSYRSDNFVDTAGSYVVGPGAAGMGSGAGPGGMPGFPAGFPVPPVPSSYGSGGANGSGPGLSYGTSRAPAPDVAGTLAAAAAGVLLAARRRR